MPAGWRTLGAPKNKRNRERTKRKRKKLSPKKTNNDPPAAAAEESRISVKSADDNPLDTIAAESKDREMNFVALKTPPKTTKEVPDVPTPKHDISVTQNLSRTADSTDQSTIELTPLVEKVEPEVTPAMEVKYETPDPEKKVRSPERGMVTNKEKDGDAIHLSPIRTRLDFDVVEVKPRLRKSLNFRSNVPKKKKKESQKAEIVPANRQDICSPEQKAGAVQGISMLWKNKFSRDAKKKIEQIEVSQMLKSIWSTSSKKDDRKDPGINIKETPKPTLNNGGNITLNSTPSGLPIGMTALGGRPSEWFGQQRSSSENRFFVPPLIPKKQSSKLNPLVKEFTPKSASNKQLQFNHLRDLGESIKNVQTQQAPTQPFIRQTTGAAMYNSTIQNYGSKPASLPFTSTLLNLQNRPIGAKTDLVQAPLMNNAMHNTQNYDYNRQNIRMINPVAQAMSRTPQSVSGAPIISSRKLHNFIVPYTAQNRTPISGQKWQTQTVTTTPTLSNHPHFGGFQHRDNSFQQRGIQQARVSSTGLAGFNQTHNVFRKPTEENLMQQSNSFGSGFQNSHKQGITRPAINNLGVRSVPLENNLVMSYSEPQSIHLTKPTTFSASGCRARSVLSRQKATAPLHKANVEPIRRPTEPTQIYKGVKPANTLANEFRHDKFSEPQRMKSRNDNAQWTFPRPLDIGNRTKMGVFKSAKPPQSSLFVDNQVLDWNASNLPITQGACPSILQNWASIWCIPHTQVFSFLTIHDLSILRRVSKSMETIVRETPYITNMVIDGTQGIIGINNVGRSKGTWVHDLDKVMRTYTSKGIRSLELQPYNYAQFFWTKFLDWLTKDDSINLRSVLVLKGSSDEEVSEDSGICDFLVGLCPEVLKIHSGIKVDADFLRRIDRPGVKALLFSREITWDQDMIRAVYDREYPLKELTLACPPERIVPWLSKFKELEKLRLLHDSTDKSRLTDKDLVTILSTVRLVALDCSLLSKWGFPEPTVSMVTTIITILTTCGESISRTWLEKTLKRVPSGLTRFHLKNLSEPLSLNHLEDVQYKPENANLEKLRGLSTPNLQITGEQCHDCRALGLDCCLVIV